MYVNNVNIYISYINIVYQLFVEDCTDVKEILFRKKCKICFFTYFYIFIAEKQFSMGKLFENKTVKFFGFEVCLVPCAYTFFTSQSNA